MKQIRLVDNSLWKGIGMLSVKNWHKNLDDETRAQLLDEGREIHDPIVSRLVKQLASLLDRVEDALLEDNWDSELAPAARRVLGCEED